jgi:hypothetical protein
MFSRFYLVVLIALAFAALSTPALAQNPNLTKRLILKDGSYQPATKWEVRGDRVRYYSAERYMWEEIPKNLIDWPATDKWNKEREENAISAETKQVSKELEDEKKKEEAQSPTVAPGVRLPANGGVMLLDHFKQEPQLVELVQSGGEVNKQMGRNILRAAINPIASAKQSIELEGAHARVQSHDTLPTIYVNIDPDSDTRKGETPVAAASRFRLVRCQVKKDVRVAGNLKVAITGQVSQQQTFVDVVSVPFSGDWVKVTPAKELAPGEYALVEMLDAKQMNLYVWDFGVNPEAPANPTAWKPVQPAPSNTGTNDSPILNKRTQ